MNLTKLLAIMDGSLKHDFGNGIIVCIVAILIVFAVLLVIIGITSGVFGLLNKYSTQETITKTTANNNVGSTNNSVVVNVDDEDMMAAIFVATIDYRNEVKEDVKVLSVREVK